MHGKPMHVKVLLIIIAVGLLFLEEHYLFEAIMYQRVSGNNTKVSEKHII